MKNLFNFFATNQSMQNLNFTQLYYFKMVVEYGSITKAAEHLSVGSSAISMQLKSFEEYLGKILFIRNKRNLVLTEDGNTVYEYSKEIFKLGSELLTHVKGPNKTRHDHIKLGIQNSIPKNLIARLTSYIYSKFDAHIEITSNNLDNLIKEISENQIDIALLNFPPIIKDKHIVRTKCILKSPIVLAGSKRFSYLKGSPLIQFSNVPMILPSTSLEARHKLEIEFMRNRLDLNIIAEVDDTIIKKNMAISGNGVIPIMREAIKDYIRDGLIEILNEELDIEDEIWLITSRRKNPNIIAEDIFKNFIF